MEEQSKEGGLEQGLEGGPVKKKISQAELIDRVKLYLKRAERDSLVEDHSLREVGYWRIISGQYGHRGGNYPLPEIIQGTFVDAVAHAVQQTRFYGDWIDSNDPGNPNNGKIERITLLQLEESSLADLVEASLKGEGAGLANASQE